MAATYRDVVAKFEGLKTTPGEHSASAGTTTTAKDLAADVRKSGKQLKSSRNLFTCLAAYIVEISPKIKAEIAEFSGIVERVYAYYTEVSQMNVLLQFLQRRGIADKVFKFYKELKSSAGPELHTPSMEKAQTARKEDKTEVAAVMKRLVDSIQTFSKDARLLTKAIESAGEPATLMMTLEDLQERDGLARTPEEEIVLRESIQLTRMMLPGYQWYKATFRTDENLTQTNIQTGLAEPIDDLVRDILNCNLLEGRTMGNIMYEPHPMRKVEHLWVVLQGRSSDAALIRKFQRSVNRFPGTQQLLEAGLDLDVKQSDEL